ncbi:MAG: hypothetical protein FWF05_05360 [Oscillospiraceae bacterium]|nr:hypothetical protein [Oscillospiraceae bacterium]
MNTFEKARAFVYRNARPLDISRWQYHFENGSREAVLTALSAYQNADGGFGHALEPDAWNPNSAPIQTWTATEILREIDFTDSAHPIIQGILRYLASGQDFDGKLWYNEVVSSNDYPHATWWHAEVDSADSYNPTACLAGFIIRFADKGSDLYQLGCRIAKEACGADDKQGLNDGMHSVILYIRLMQYCEEAGVTEVIDLSALKKRLREKVGRSITKDTSKWETDYVCKPSQFFNTRDSIFYADNRDIAEYECEFIVKSQLADGSWNIPWGWGAYPEEWAVSKKWWQGNGAVLNMLYLKGFGKLLPF